MTKKPKISDILLGITIIWLLIITLAPSQAQPAENTENTAIPENARNCLAAFEISGEFRTIQTAGLPEIIGKRTILLTDATNPSIQYIVSLDRCILYQNIAPSARKSMPDAYGSGSITCEMPDGKIMTGTADKINIDPNADTAEFIMGNTWYYTGTNRVLINLY